MTSKKTGIEGAIEPPPTAHAPWWVRKTIPGGSGPVDWVEIGVVSYHQSLDDFPSEVTCYHVWPHWPVVAAFDDVLREEANKLKGGIATAHHIMRQAFKTATQGSGDIYFREQPVDPKYGAMGLSAYIVSGPYATVQKYADRFLQEVANDATDVGGDDDYFDYYPDRVYCALQLAIPLGLGKQYGRAYEKIMIRYADMEPHVIPTWEDTAPKEVDE